MKKVKLKSDVMVGTKRLAAREGKAPRFGPHIVHTLANDVADDLIARGDAEEVKDSGAAPRVRKAVSEPATRAVAEAKERSEPKSPAE